MKSTSWLKYLPVIWASICFAPVALTQAYPADQVHIAQVASNYDRYMKIGYTAIATRDYQTALINFKQALKVSPGNHHALNAIRNVSSYIEALKDRSITFIPPNRGAPSNRHSAATRSACSSEKKLTALIPEKNPALTTAEYPVLFYYLPQTSAQTLEFVLLDQENTEIYKTNFAPTRTPGIVSLNLSAFKGLPPLEIGKNYHWYFLINCAPQDSSADIFVDGEVRRIELDPILANQLKTAKPRDRAFVYAVNGIWYDTLRALAEARQSSPNDSSLADEWADLLKSVGLDEIARQPLVGAAQ